MSNPSSSPDNLPGTKAVARVPPAHANQGYLPLEDEELYREIFTRLDKNKDGHIDIDELIDVFSENATGGDPERDVKLRERIQRFIDRADYLQDRRVSLLEFLQYCVESEKNLKITFKHLDKDDDGKVSTEDLRQHFQSLGANIQDVSKVVESMDMNGNLEVNFDEFKSFFFQPRHIMHHHIDEIFDSITAHALDAGTEDVLIRDDSKIEGQTGDWWRHLVAGACAGTTSRTCTAPLDRLKVFLQVHASKHNGLTVYSAFKHMLEEGGYRSLWRGNGMNVMKIMPEMALKFYTYEYAKRFIKSRSGHDSELTIGERLVAGAFAGAFSQSIIYPLEVLKTRLVLRKSGQFDGVRGCVSSMLRNEGPMAFYKGYLPNILGIMPYAGVDLAVYETLKRKYLRHLDKQEPEAAVVLMCGMCSSTMGQLVSYPLALVRTKLQAQVSGNRMRETVIRLNPSLVGHKGATFSGIFRGHIPPLYHPTHTSPTAGSPTTDTMVSLFQQIWRQEGLPGFYRGIFPNMAKVMPAVGISYVAYEQVRQVLGAQMS